MEKFQKINKLAGCNKAMQVGNFQKINNLCSTFIRYSKVCTLPSLDHFFLENENTTQ